MSTTLSGVVQITVSSRSCWSRQPQKVFSMWWVVYKGWAISEILLPSVDSLLPARGYAAGRVRALTNLGVRIAAVVSSRLLTFRDRRPSARLAYCGDHMRGWQPGARLAL